MRDGRTAITRNQDRRVGEESINGIVKKRKPIIVMIMMMAIGVHYNIH